MQILSLFLICRDDSSEYNTFVGLFLQCEFVFLKRFWAFNHDENGQKSPSWSWSFYKRETCLRRQYFVQTVESSSQPQCEVSCMIHVWWLIIQGWWISDSLSYLDSNTSLLLQRDSLYKMISAGNIKRDNFWSFYYHTL